MQKVAVVILNWNGQAFLEQFLADVVQKSRPYKVVLADNASTDHSVEWTKNNCPDVEIVINTSNGGFAKGYNDALKHIQAEYFILLNSDVEVTENWIEPLLALMNNPKVVACQPQILSYHRRDEFEHAGAAGGFIDKYHYPFCRGRIVNHFEKNTGQYNSDSRIFWSTGACMLIRSDIFHQLDGFDERFFAHMEEIDLCWRIQRLGYELMETSKSTVYHVGGGTLNYNNPRKTFLNFRNSLLMIHKNQEQFLWWVLFRRLCLDGLAAMTFLFQGNFKHFAAVFNAHMSFYKLLPSSRIERKKWKHLPHKATHGIYHGSILWALKVLKIKTFSALNQRKFEL